MTRRDVGRVEVGNNKNANVLLETKTATTTVATVTVVMRSDRMMAT
jgi:hypothetical protein